MKTNRLSTNTHTRKYIINIVQLLGHGKTLNIALLQKHRLRKRLGNEDV